MRMRVKKKLIIICISIIVFLFIAMFIMLFFNNKYISDIKNNVSLNTDIENIEYVNKYDNNYIVVNDKYLYLLDSDYKEITKIEISLIYVNKNNYDIVYRDKTIMYMNNYKNEDGVIFEYYDIYSYELIDKIVIGGN